MTRWFSRWTPHRPADEDPVRIWKTAWADGMHASWTGSGQTTNPHPGGSAAANAWTAGWRWGGEHPDRRAKVPSRLAHPRRRATDSSLVVTRSMQATVGVSTLVVAGWIWKMRRGNGRTGSGPDGSSSR